MRQSLDSFREHGEGVGKMAYDPSAERRSMLELGLSAISTGRTDEKFFLGLGVFYRRALLETRSEDEPVVLGRRQPVAGLEPMRDELIFNLAPTVRVNDRVTVAGKVEAALSGEARGLTGWITLSRAL
jgi:hypothetical protein